jgi:hypothetical protein
VAFEAEAERAAKHGRRLGDPRLAALAAERAGELLERRAAIYAHWRWRSLVLLGVLTLAAFFEGRAGVLSPIEIVLPLAFWLGVHVFERRYQERVRRAAEANAELARSAGFTVQSLLPRDDRQLPRLAPAALATASIVSAALLGYTLRPPPYHDLIHEAYVADLNRICAHEHAALAAIPMTRRVDRWQKYFTAELSARARSRLSTAFVSRGHGSVGASNGSARIGVRFSRSCARLWPTGGSTTTSSFWRASARTAMRSRRTASQAPQARADASSCPKQPRPESATPGV